jgi:hypothetical protein
MIVGAIGGSSVLGITDGVKLVGKVEGVSLGRSDVGNDVGLRVGKVVGNSVGTCDGMLLG